MRKAFQRSLTKQGFKFKLNTKVNGATIEGGTVKLELETKKGEKETFEADAVLVSAGMISVCTPLQAAAAEASHASLTIFCMSHQIIQTSTIDLSLSSVITMLEVLAGMYACLFCSMQHAFKQYLCNRLCWLCPHETRSNTVSLPTTSCLAQSFTRHSQPISGLTIILVNCFILTDLAVIG